jgi:hypothetical protein
MFDEETVVAWKAVPKHALVVASDGTELGAVEEILGDEEEDIFHGVALKRAEDGELVEVPAGRITKMTMEHVVTDLTPDEAKALPAYRKR